MSYHDVYRVRPADHPPDKPYGTVILLLGLHHEHSAAIRAGQALHPCPDQAAMYG